MSDIEAAALAYTEARKRRLQSKQALRDYRYEYGSCEGNMPYRGICYTETCLPFEEWCDICRGSQPLWLERKAAAVEVGKTLRRLTYLCRKAPSNAEVNPS